MTSSPSLNAPRTNQRRRGELGPVARVGTHVTLTVASLIALFPIVWLVYLSLGPDKDDYLHPGGIFAKATLDNYSFVLTNTAFFNWLWSTLVVAGARPCSA